MLYSKGLAVISTKKLENIVFARVQSANFCAYLLMLVSMVLANDLSNLCATRKQHFAFVL
jgi:hypothetical protein